MMGNQEVRIASFRLTYEIVGIVVTGSVALPKAFYHIP